MKIFATFLLLFGVTYFHCLGCICTPKPLDEYLKQNDSLPMGEQVVVFKGVVESVYDSLVINKFGYGQLVKLQVLEYWPEKGLQFLKTPFVTVFNDELDCSVSFLTDSTYLVRAYSFNRYLATSVCEGTKLLSQSQRDLDLLGKGSGLNYTEVTLISKPDLEVEMEKKFDFGIYEILLAFSFLLNGFLVIWLLSQRRG